MEAIAYLLVFIIVVTVGFLAMKKLDIFMDENQREQQNQSECTNEIIKIACENPIMLSYVVEIIERQHKALETVAFEFYTGCREDIRQKQLSYDIIMLMTEPEYGAFPDCEHKEGMFHPSFAVEPFTNQKVKPIEKQKSLLYILWNEKNMTEAKRTLVSMM